MAGQHTISVATFNIHHGADETGAPAIEAQAALLRDICADAVALQECDVGVPRSGRVDQVALLASLAEYPYHAFGANVHLDGGDYGCAILSRLPLSDVLNMPVPQSDNTVPHLHIDGRTHHRERRGILEALVETDLGPVVLIVAHASVWPDERVRGSEAILARLALWDGPAVVTGDFNVEDPDAPEIAMLRAALSDAHEDAGAAQATYPSSAPTHRIDRIMSRGLTALTAQTVPTGASDHSALRASFALPERWRLAGAPTGGIHGLGMPGAKAARPARARRIDLSGAADSLPPRCRRPTDDHAVRRLFEKSTFLTEAPSR